MDYHGNVAGFFRKIQAPMRVTTKEQERHHKEIERGHPARARQVAVKVAKREKVSVITAEVHLTGDSVNQRTDDDEGELSE